MSYYDWEHLVKPLTVIPVVEDTVENIKPLSLTPVNDISVKSVKILIPAVVYTDNNILIQPLIITQYNFSIGHNVVFVNFNDYTLTQANHFKIVLCVRYRVGTTVTRYLLTRVTYNHIGSPFEGFSYFNQYEGQTIKGNFVIEVWQTRANPIPAIKKDIYLDTGIVIIPTSDQQGDTIIQANEIVTITTLETALPETLPTAQNASGPWLDNP